MIKFLVTFAYMCAFLVVFPVLMIGPPLALVIGFDVATEWWAPLVMVPWGGLVVAGFSAWMDSR